MSTLINRIEEIQSKMGWDDKAMGDVAGVSRSAVAQWRGQGSKIIHTIGDIEAAVNLERATGYSALWIARGKGEKLVSKAPFSRQWPFPQIDESKVYAMKGDDAVALERAFIVAASNVGLDIKKP